MLPGRVARRNRRACRDIRRAADAVTAATTYREVMADHDMSRREARQRASWGIGIALGMGVGVAMGSALDNMGMGIAIGIAIGIAFALAFGASGRRKPGDGSADETADGPETDGPQDAATDGDAFDDDADPDGPGSVR